MKTLTDVVVALIQMMEAKEQDEFLATMAQGKRPTKAPRPMTDCERWWHNKLNTQDEKDWITETTSDALVDDFIKHTGFKKSRRSASTTMGIMLGKICPEIRRYDDKLIIPGLKQARRAFNDVFPSGRPVASAPSGPGASSGPTLVIDGKTVKVLKTTIID